MDASEPRCSPLLGAKNNITILSLVPFNIKFYFFLLIGKELGAGEFRTQVTDIITK